MYDRLIAHAKRLRKELEDTADLNECAIAQDAIIVLEELEELLTQLITNTSHDD